MGNKKININNRTYYFFNDMVNIADFDWSLLKIEKKSYKKIDIYYIAYITIKKIDDYENIHSVYPLYLIIGKVDGFHEEKNGRKYLVFDSVDENKEVLTNYAKLWDEIKNKIEISGGKKGEYGEYFIIIKFHTDNDMPLNKLLKLHILTIIVRSDFEEDGNFYPHIYLDQCFYEL